MIADSSNSCKKNNSSKNRSSRGGGGVLGWDVEADGLIGFGVNWCNIHVCLCSNCTCYIITAVFLLEL